MNKRDTILSELQSISPEVARCPHAVPYVVPAGYFDGLPLRMLTLAKALESPLPAVLQAAIANPFAVPAGYFEGLPALVLQRAKEQEDVISPVLQTATTNPYRVPAGYFDNLPALVLQRAREQEPVISPVLQAMAANPYRVPAGYFESLPAVVLQRAKAAAEDETINAADELAALSPLLSGLSKKMPFAAPEGYFAGLPGKAAANEQVMSDEELSPLMASLQSKMTYTAPAGYFDTFSTQLLHTIQSGQLASKAKTEQKETAKVISLQERTVTGNGGTVRIFSMASRIMRYAAAAVVVGVVAIGVWKYNGKSVAPADPKGIAQVKDASPAGLDNLSEAELQSYLDEQTAPLAAEVLAMNTKDAEIKAGDMSDLLVDVSDEEIQKYLEQNTLITKNTSTN